MTAIELQTEYQNLVGIIAHKDTETILKAVQALRKILTPAKKHQFTKEDLVIDPRVASMSVDMGLPNSFDYKEEYYKKYMKE